MVWRRVLVPDTIKLQDLHGVILRAFGWSGSRAHAFITSQGNRYGNWEPHDELPRLARSASVRLTTVLRTATVRYVYDFGSPWEHRIQLEAARSADSELCLPLCVGGACATPPDDFGGIRGYAEFVRVMSDRSDPERELFAMWIGQDNWDPNAIDLDEINARLGEIQA